MSKLKCTLLISRIALATVTGSGLAVASLNVLAERGIYLGGAFGMS